MENKVTQRSTTSIYVPPAAIVSSDVTVALKAGLINEVVEDADLVAAAERLIAKLANKSPLGLRRMKVLVNGGLEQSQESAVRLELALFKVHARSLDMQEGLAAFEEKRTPRFSGQ